MNRLAVSNIAWSTEEDAAAYTMLAGRGVRLLEIAPGRFWTDLSQVSSLDIKSACDPAHRAGLDIVAFQAILFGKPDMLLFDSDTRPALAEYLIRMAEICSLAGAKTLVFGAPGNRRVPDGMESGQVMEIAVDFFYHIGTRAADLGVCFGIEANPLEYRCNFCTHAAEVIELVRRVDSPGVRWHVDAGELGMNQENVEAVIELGRDVICHAHLSEAMLGPFDQPWEGHATMISALDRAGYAGPLSVEMKRPENGLAGVAAAIDFAHSLGVR